MSAVTEYLHYCRYGVCIVGRRQCCLALDSSKTSHVESCIQCNDAALNVDFACGLPKPSLQVKSTIRLMRGGVVRRTVMSWRQHATSVHSACRQQLPPVCVCVPIQLRCVVTSQELTCYEIR